MWNMYMNRREAWKLAGGAASLVLAGGFRAPTGRASGAYTLHEIGETDYAPGPYNNILFFPVSINEAGVIVGTMRIDSEKVSPWIFSEGRRSRIPTGTFGAHARGINDEGVICGQDIVEWYGLDYPHGNPVIWRDGAKEALAIPGELSAPHLTGIALSINNAGDVVGTVEDSNGIGYPTLWQNGEPSLLPSPYRWPTGRADFINDAGTIVGTVYDDFVQPKVVVWDRGDVRLMDAPDGTFSHISALTSDGKLVGSQTINNVTRAVVWESPDSPPAPLGMLTENQVFSMALDGTADGVIVGQIQVGFGDFRAVMWIDGEAIDLSELVESTGQLRLASATAINSSGWIAGAAFFLGPNTVTIHSFLTEPVI